MTPARNDAPPRLIRFADAGAQARHAAGLAARALTRAVALRGAASLAVSGGSTPALFFAQLAGADLPWRAVHLFFVDERCVAPDDARSNYLLVRRTLLARAPLCNDTVWPMPGEAAPEEGARAYEDLVRRVFAQRLGQPGPDLPRFDCVHLGMGADGHTASLFPGQPALDETDRLVTVARPPKADPPVARLTMTLPLLCAAREVFFLVSGPDKSALAQAIATGTGGQDRPAAQVRPRNAPAWLVLA